MIVIPTNAMISPTRLCSVQSVLESSIFSSRHFESAKLSYKNFGVRHRSVSCIYKYTCFQRDSSSQYCTFWALLAVLHCVVVELFASNGEFVWKGWVLNFVHDDEIVVAIDCNFLFIYALKC